MTNFQGGVPRRLSREQVLLWGPVLLGALLASVAGGLLLWPAMQQLQRDQQQLHDLKEQEARVPLVRQQLTKLRENVAQAEQKEGQILELIAGSGDISTFMAQLGQEARRSGVQLDSYEPTTATAPPAGAPTAPAAPPPAQAKPNQAPPIAADPLLAPGLEKTTLLITARGSGPQLQDFLRRIERLRLLVVQSDLTLKHEAGAPGSNGKPVAAGITTLKLSLSLYAKAQVPQPGVPAAVP